MKKEIYLVGLNYKTAPVEVRERFALSDPAVLEKGVVPLGEIIRECVILSTCNRVEILAAARGKGVPDLLLEHWAAARGQKHTDLRPYVYIHKGADAVKHLFTVAASLDSMVLGEPQILGQLKDAYRAAVAGQTSRIILNRLLHKAFSVAKRVRTETAIASSAVSISYAAVELAKRIFGDMSGIRAMLIGAGEMAELAATHLVNAGISSVWVANRTHERAVRLAAQFGGAAVPFDCLVDHMAQVDIIISSTGAVEPIIRARDMRGVLKRRKNRPMFFIDIAVPRDIDPDVNGLDNVYLYDIDDLKEVVEENLANRREEASKGHDIVAAESAVFCRWLKSLDMQPTIVDLIRRGEHIAHEEMARTLKRLGPLSDEQRAALEAMLCAVVKKLNHEPISYLKRHFDDTEEEAAAGHANMVRRIFNLDGDRIPDRPHRGRTAVPSGPHPSEPCPCKQDAR